MQSVEALLLSSTSAGVAAAVQRDGHSLFGPSFVERFDLATGRSLNTAKIDETLVVFDLSPNGRLLATRKMYAGLLQSRQIDVWRVDADGTAPQAISFEAVEKTPDADFPKWAHFVGDDSLLILTDNGALSFWNIHSAKEVWRANCGHDASADTSPNGKYVAVASGHRAIVIEAVTGKALGYIDLGNRPAGLVSFKPDGTSVAIAGADSLVFWNAQTGKLFQEMDVAGVAGTAIEWGKDGYLLLDQRRLVSLDKRRVVWTYLIGSIVVYRCTQSIEGRLWGPAKDESNKNVIVSVPLPDDSVRGIVFAVGDPKIALKSGGSVGLEVQGGRGVKEITDVLAARLTESGFTVAEHQPLSTIATTEPMGPGQQIMIQVGRKTEYAPMQNLLETISLRSDDGKVLWTRSAFFNPPGTLILKPGESIEQAVAAATDPSGFFRNVFIPRTFLQKPAGFGAPQKSKWRRAS